LIEKQQAATGIGGASPLQPGRAQYPATDFQGSLTPVGVSGRLEVVSVMRLNAKKRPFALLRVIARLKQLLPAGAGVHLRIVGDGPERKRLERAIMRRGLSDSVEVLGRRTHEELRALYEDCDAFLLPTIRESFGIAAAEARCAGLPIVARGGSGVADWIEQEQDGLLASTDDALADALHRLITDERLRARISEHNRTTTPSMDWPAVLARHLELYARAIALRRSVSV